MVRGRSDGCVSWKHEVPSSLRGREMEKGNLEIGSTATVIYVYKLIKP
jgi:hypothetical protein